MGVSASKGPRSSPPPSPGCMSTSEAATQAGSLLFAQPPCWSPRHKTQALATLGWIRWMDYGRGGEQGSLPSGPATPQPWGGTGSTPDHRLHGPQRQTWLWGGLPQKTESFRQDLARWQHKLLTFSGHRVLKSKTFVTFSHARLCRQRPVHSLQEPSPGRHSPRGGLGGREPPPTPLPLMGSSQARGGDRVS